MRISFCHSGNAGVASYRYRAIAPVETLREETFDGRPIEAYINDATADVMVFAKPVLEDVHYAAKTHRRGGKVIVDVCDWHFDQKHYPLLVSMADLVTCPTQWMAEYLRTDYGVEAEVIPDPYEFPLRDPHCNGGKCLWFGNAVNYDSLTAVLPYLEGVDLHVVSNVDGDIPWSWKTMIEEFARADIVIMPQTLPYKSANRSVEAIRQGCFVVADPHPSLEDLEGTIYIGAIKRGIEWAQQNQQEANNMTRKAQVIVEEKYGRRTLAYAWKNAIRKVLSASTSDQAISTGLDG